MINHKQSLPLLGVTAVAATLMCGLSGCGKDEPAPTQVRQAAPPPPPPPAKPSVAPVSELMAQLGIDERVVLLEEDAPDTTEARKAVLEFFDAFARGDVTDLSRLMSTVDAAELQEMVDEGEWQRTIDGVTEIQVRTGQSPYGDESALALFVVDGRTQPQLWTYVVDEMEGTTFDAVATPPNIMDKLYGQDWISVWYQLIEEELAKADEPDDDLSPPPVTLEQPMGSGGSTPPAATPSSPSDPSVPASPGGPGRRPPPSRRRPPPGPGG